ncbi:MAG: DUF61 family protein, partial [Crenarchaeota archaeon]|nr:DUF61 family protein [Thermoproteota archaeon]
MSTLGGDAEEKILRALLAEELRISNKHLPAKRVPLKQLLEMEYPCVRLRDGTLHYFRKRELRELAEVARDLADRLLLPILIVLRSDMGEGTAVIDDEVAARVVARLLGINHRGGPLHLYRPQVAELRERFDTVFQIAIFIPLDQVDKGF